MIGSEPKILLGRNLVVVHDWFNENAVIEDRLLEKDDVVLLTGMHSFFPQPTCD